MRSHPRLPRLAQRARRTALLVFLVLALFVVLLLLARPARAQQWFDAKDGQLEDRFTDGDIDVDDLARIPALGRRGSSGSTVFAQTWLSLVAFESELPSGTHEIGGFAVLGLAIDKIAHGRASVVIRPSFADGEPGQPPRPPQPPAAEPQPPRLVLDAALARGAVRAAWRTSGIGVTDERIDEMIARSRLSAVLPETRLRVMQVFQDGQHTTSYVDEAGTVVDTSGATTTLEARLTWRFDRLLFTEDETRLERVRFERQDTRSRMAGRVLELLFTWQRSLLDAASSDSGSRAELDAMLRQYEAETSLDVLTGGWFGAQPVVHGHHVTPPRPQGSQPR